MKKNENRARRSDRVRYRVKGSAKGKPRLSVFRSSQHIYAQILDDEKGQTLVAASMLEEGISGKLKTTKDKEAAKIVGKLVAERAVKAGISNVVFDRGGYPFHGRVAALAEAAREGGLQF